MNHNVLNEPGALENNHSFSQNELNNRLSAVENENKQMFQHMQNIARTTSERHSLT